MRSSGGFAGLLVVDMHMPSSQSLKDKRAPLRSIKARLHSAGFSVAEVAHHDTWQRAQLAISMVGRSTADVERELNVAVHICEQDPRVEVSVHQRTVLGMDEFDA